MLINEMNGMSTATMSIVAQLTGEELMNCKLQQYFKLIKSNGIPLRWNNGTKNKSMKWNVNENGVQSKCIKEHDRNKSDI